MLCVLYVLLWLIVFIFQYEAYKKIIYVYMFYIYLCYELINANKKNRIIVFMFVIYFFIHIMTGVLTVLIILQIVPFQRFAIVLVCFYTGIRLQIWTSWCGKNQLRVVFRFWTYISHTYVSRAMIGRLRALSMRSFVLIRDWELLSLSPVSVVHFQVEPFSHEWFCSWDTCNHASGV